MRDLTRGCSSSRRSRGKRNGLARFLSRSTLMFSPFSLLPSPLSPLRLRHSISFLTPLRSPSRGSLWTSLPLSPFIDPQPLFLRPFLPFGTAFGFPQPSSSCCHVKVCILYGLGRSFGQLRELWRAITKNRKVCGLKISSSTSQGQRRNLVK